MTGERGRSSFERRIWMAALGAFVVAALTGTWFRTIMHLGWETTLILPNVRHAHSHLMYFAWATPMLMLLILRGFDQAPADVLRRSRRLISTAIVLGGLAYLPFLLYGYTFAEIGGLTVPLSITLSTSSLLVWYAFAWEYRKIRNSGPPSLARQFLDAAMVFLALASLGAWALGAVMGAKPANPIWYQLALHLFMDVFAVGWLLMAVLGLLVRGMESSLDPVRVRQAWWLMVLGTPATFLLGVHPDQLPPLVRLIGSAGGLMVGSGILLLVRSIGSAVPRPWRLPLALMPVQAAGLIGLAFPAVAAWGFATGLRIPYLHVVLLGIVTPGLVAAAGDVWGGRRIRGWALLQVGALVLLLSLLPLTGFWPAGLQGPLTGWIVVAGSLVPVCGALIMLGMGLGREPRNLHDRT